MIDSRDKIMAAARGVSGAQAEDRSKIDALEERIANAIADVTPPTRDGLLKQFADELDVVSAEFYHVGNHDSAADKVAEIMSENACSRLAITGEPEIVAIARAATQRTPGSEVVNALDLTCDERKGLLAQIPTALAKAAFAVADMGSLVFVYDRSRTSLPYFLADCVIVVVARNDLVANHFDLLDKLDPVEARNMVFVTGPSRTADIEKILILGAHGPRRLVVLLVDD